MLDIVDDLYAQPDELLPGVISDEILEAMHTLAFLHRQKGDGEISAAYQKVLVDAIATMAGGYVATLLADIELALPGLLAGTKGHLVMDKRLFQKLMISTSLYFDRTIEAREEEQQPTP